MVWNFFATGHGKGEVDEASVYSSEKFERSRSSPKAKKYKMWLRL
jgi:hypothetical protein